MIEAAVKFLDMLGMNLLRNTVAYEVSLKLLGVSISPGVTIDTSINTAFDLLSIGADTMIENKAMISCQSYQAECLFLTEVAIGEVAVVDQRAVIQPFAMTWSVKAEEGGRGPGSALRPTHAALPSKYDQPDNTVLKQGASEPASFPSPISRSPTAWKRLSAIPLARWIYAIGFLWLSDTAVALSALSSVKALIYIVEWCQLLPGGLMQSVTHELKRTYIFAFALCPYLFIPNVYLLSRREATAPLRELAVQQATTYQQLIGILSAKSLALALLLY